MDLRARDWRDGSGCPRHLRRLAPWLRIPITSGRGPCAAVATEGLMADGLVPGRLAAGRVRPWCGRPGLVACAAGTGAPGSPEFAQAGVRGV
jgi:hypothetical protein